MLKISSKDLAFFHEPEWHIATLICQIIAVFVILLPASLSAKITELFEKPKIAERKYSCTQTKVIFKFQVIQLIKCSLPMLHYLEECL